MGDQQVYLDRGGNSPGGVGERFFPALRRSGLRDVDVFIRAPGHGGVALCCDPRHAVLAFARVELDSPYHVAETVVAVARRAGVRTRVISRAAAGLALSWPLSYATVRLVTGGDDSYSSPALGPVTLGTAAAVALYLGTDRWERHATAALARRWVGTDATRDRPALPTA